MVTTINKDLLKNYRFSDNPNAWILEARGFCRSAELLLQSLKNRRPAPSKFISAEEINLNYMCNKIASYLYSIAIELFLKGLYCLNKTSEDQEKTESFRHDTIKLNQKLIAKKILKQDELSKETLKLANIILEWSGRYYKPQRDKIDEIIESHFEEVPDQPEMVKPKFSINSETITKLKDMAKQLSDKAPANLSSIESLLFLPF